LQWLYTYVANVCFSCSLCWSRCCSPRVLTHGHAHTTCTHLALAISVIQASSNNRTCTQWAISAQTAEHSPVKSACAHAERQSGPAPLALGYACCAPSFSMQLGEPTHMLSRAGGAAVGAGTRLNSMRGHPDTPVCPDTLEPLCKLGMQRKIP
jgi:hypothetical protein